MKTSEDLVRAFADLFDEVEPETPEEVDVALREAGYDPDQVAARMKAVAQEALEWTAEHSGRGELRRG